MRNLSNTANAYRPMFGYHNYGGGGGRCVSRRDRADGAMQCAKKRFSRKTPMCRTVWDLNDPRLTCGQPPQQFSFFLRLLEAPKDHCRCLCAAKPLGDVLLFVRALRVYTMCLRVKGLPLLESCRVVEVAADWLHEVNMASRSRRVSRIQSCDADNCRNAKHDAATQAARQNSPSSSVPEAHSSKSIE